MLSKEIKSMKKLSAALLALVMLFSSVTCISAVDFEDVSDDDWFAEAVEWAYNESIMKGVSDTHFEPHEKITRSMLMTILHRVAGEPDAASAAPFTDLTEDWYKKSVAWAYESGITKGTSATEFSPYEILSRETIATILYRFLTSAKPDLKCTADLSAYSDGGEVSDWAKDGMSWAAADGIIACSDGKLLPREGVSRAECASSFMKFCEKYRSVITGGDNPAEDDAYKTIETPTKKFVYTRKYFAKKDSTTALILSYPQNWSFAVTDRATFTYKGVEIGYVIPADVSSNGWKTVAETSFAKDDLKTTQYIEKSGTGSTLAFRYRYVYTGLGETMTAVFDYKYINAKTAENLLRETYLVSTVTEPNIGILSSLKNTKSVLVFGNSFVSTSCVGVILSDMFASNGVRTSVTSNQRGNASLATYASDTAFMNRIRNGAYGAVFACGLYSSEDIDALKKLDEACKRSGTTLVLFPAHNETPQFISRAKEEFPHIIMLDWKAELNALINGGKNILDFCYDDSIFHSKPLAGYVGAHMIYRAIFGETPSGKISGEISQTTVENKLGDYVKTGSAQRVRASSIKYFE